MTTKPRPEKDHDKDKHLEKDHDKHPERERQQRVEMKGKGDEIVVTHGTKDYHVPREGHIDLPPEVAAHVIRQGGALAVDEPNPKSDNSIKVKHVNDPTASLGHGGQIYQPDSNGEMTIPVEILEEVEPHGFARVPEDDGSRK